MHALRCWNKNIIVNIFELIKTSHNRLNFLASNNITTSETWMEVIDQHNMLLYLENTYRRQLSRDRVIMDNDRNHVY